jgi:hypothetical protein
MCSVLETSRSTAQATLLDQKVEAKMSSNANAIVAGVLISVATAAVCAAVIFTTPIGVLLMEMLVLSAGPSLTPILMGCASVSIAAASGGLVGVIIHMRSAHPAPDIPQEVAPLGTMSGASPSRPDKFLVEVSDLEVIGALKSHAPAVDGISIDARGYVVIPKDGKYFQILGKDGLSLVYKNDLTDGKIDPRNLLPNVAALIPGELLASIVELTTAGAPPPPPPSPPPPPEGQAAAKPTVVVVSPEQISETASAKLPTGLKFNTQGQFVDARDPSKCMLILDKRGTPINGKIADLTQIPGWRLTDEQRKAYPSGWIDSAAEPPKAGQAQAVQTSAAAADPSDLATAETEPVSDDPALEGMHVVCGSDGVYRLVDARNPNQKSYIVDTNGNPIPWTALTQGGEIPGYLNAKSSSSDPIPVSWTNPNAKPPDATVQAMALRNPGVFLGKRDKQNATRLSNFGIATNDKNGKLTLGGTDLRTKGGKTSTIKLLTADGLIPLSQLHSESQKALRDALKAESPEELADKKTTLEQIIVQTKEKLETFDASVRSVTDAVAAYEDGLDAKLNDAGVPTVVSSAEDRQKIVNVRGALNKYINASLRGPPATEKTDLRRTMGLAQVGIARASPADQENAKKFDAFLQHVDPYIAALKEAGQTAPLTKGDIPKAMSGIKDKLKNLQAERQQELEAMEQRLADAKAGKTKFAQVVDENA